MVSNPPMGRRVRVPDLRGLIAALFEVAARVLKPGGRLVFVNPVKLAPTDPSLRLEFRETVDMGGYDAYLERYRKG
jgi:tRNA G10  N-methylase Trm11